MPRVRLEPRPRYPHAVDLTVRTTDLNYGGHLGNDRLLSLVHEARVAFLASEGWSELDMGGRAVIMADAALTYRGEAFAGDVLRFETAAAEVERSGVRLCHRVTRPADGTLIALAETGLAGFDYAARRVAPWPDAVHARLSALAAEAGS